MNNNQILTILTLKFDDIRYQTNRINLQYLFAYYFTLKRYYNAR